MYEFPDANVCNLGCKRLHSRLQVFASVWDSAIFGYVNNSKSACKCVSNMALSLVRFVSYVRKACFIRFQPPIFALFCVAQMQVSRASVHSDGFWEHFWETKSKQNDDIESTFVRWAEKEHGGEMSSSPCFFGLGYPVSNQN